MKSFTQLAIIVGLTFAAAGATYFVKGAPVRMVMCDPSTRKPDEICLGEVVEPVVWIDARSRKAWEKDGLEGSILWNLDTAEDAQELEANAVMHIMQNPHVVVYCDDENCGLSRQVAAKVRALDLGADVKVLRGGWRALKEAGRIKGSN